MKTVALIRFKQRNSKNVHLFHLLVETVFRIRIRMDPGFFVDLDRRFFKLCDLNVGFDKVLEEPGQNGR